MTGFRSQSSVDLFVTDRLLVSFVRTVATMLVTSFDGGISVHAPVSVSSNGLTPSTLHATFYSHTLLVNITQILPLTGTPLDYLNIILDSIMDYYNFKCQM